MPKHDGRLTVYVQTDDATATLPFTEESHYSLLHRYSAVTKIMPGKQQAAYNTIRVRYFATLRDLVGRKEDELQLPPGATVREAITALVERHGRAFREFVLTTDGQLRPRLSMLINGDVVSPAGIGRTRLPLGSELVIMPPVSGGNGMVAVAVQSSSTDP